MSGIEQREIPVSDDFMRALKSVGAPESLLARVRVQSASVMQPGDGPLTKGNADSTVREAANPYEAQVPSEIGKSGRYLRIGVTGSIALDRVMHFDGDFSGMLPTDNIRGDAISFPANDMAEIPGGTAANICYGMAKLGVQPVLLGAIGSDLLDYLRELESQGVDVSNVHVSDDRKSAEFLNTFDKVGKQMATFYYGAMSESDRIDLATVHARTPLDLVLIGPTTQKAMLKHTQQCKELRIPFISDPAQQIIWEDEGTLRSYLDGAACVISNHYEAADIEDRTRWTWIEIKSHVGMRVITNGEQGCTLEGVWGGRDLEAAEVSAIRPKQNSTLDQSGVGDGFRAGFLAGLACHLSPYEAACLGSAISTIVLETPANQDYEINVGQLRGRLEATYKEETAERIMSALALESR